MPRTYPAGFPTRPQILDFIAHSAEPAGKREIGRAFGLKGQERVKLKALLREIGRASCRERVCYPV